ncbi:hypothetical protein [Nocardia iowensis]|uniref:Uncharacterized protein n=1 Tax=Nocardia iowensis TaxID=204891 RepID=A0ABX8RXJ5_NOCIO|nr:hypothetical protein [Nocardia iowensis]QXN94390.1 hypothetical protein KV110_15810 [Nocardia iowensis]
MAVLGASVMVAAVGTGPAVAEIRLEPTAPRVEVQPVGDTPATGSATGSACFLPLIIAGKVVGC